MRKIVVSEFVSLDGVMEDPGGAEKTRHAGWTRPYWDDGIAKFKYEELFASDALLLGRVTYEGFAKAWPTMEGTGDFGEKMNSISKYVVSSTLKIAEWKNSMVLSGNVAEHLAQLKQQPGKNILVAGSAQLVQMLIQHDLIDEYRLLVYPVILGSGKRLFTADQKAVLKLEQAQSFKSGVVGLEYKSVKKE